MFATIGCRIQTVFKRISFCMNRVTIIAEAGVNHNGDVEIAKRMIDEAKKAGADIVKFQTFQADKLASEKADLADYQKNNLGYVESQRQMLKRLMLDQEEFVSLSSYCKNIGVKFLSTPFDIESIHFLDKLQDVWKIPSGEITNYPYLVEIAKTGKSVILSTGMSTLEEVEAAVDVLKQNGAGTIRLLHCTTNYPTPMADVNLYAMNDMRKKFNLEVGYSDHTDGIEVAVAAVALGAVIIEKHFTLDRNMKGPDHKASLEPKELTLMIRAIRNIEIAVGDGVKRPMDSELANVLVARKSIVASRDIKEGEVYSEDNITTKRPGNGVNPMRWNEVIGARAIRDFHKDDLIEL